MGKSSASKKVARVARTGGGRTRRGSSSWLWPVVMALVVVMGTAGIVYSREQREPDTTPPLAGGPGRPGDHWHAAIGFYLCDTFAPNLVEPSDPLGIHTHGDGVVHIHPFSSRSAGDNARLGIFFDTVDAEVSQNRLKLPGYDARRDGDMCGGQPGTVQVKVWPSRDPAEEGALFPGDPDDIRLLDGQLITVAFAPEGAEIPRPPSEANLDSLTDLGTQPVPNELVTTVPPGPQPADTPPGSEPEEPSTGPPESAPPAP